MNDSNKLTRRAAFPAEMDQVVPWKDLCQLIEPVYPMPGALLQTRGSRARRVDERSCSRSFNLEPFTEQPDDLSQGACAETESAFDQACLTTDVAREIECGRRPFRSARITSKPLIVA